MRFNSVQEVREYAEHAALNDWAMYLNCRSDFNPYCTQGARACWERGFIGAAPYSWETNLEWDYQYQRGAAAARLIQEMLCTGQRWTS